MSRLQTEIGEVRGEDLSEEPVFDPGHLIEIEIECVRFVRSFDI